MRQLFDCSNTRQAHIRLLLDSRCYPCSLLHNPLFRASCFDPAVVAIPCVSNVNIVYAFVLSCPWIRSTMASPVFLLSASCCPGWCMHCC